ncbi:MAG TPA: hypothetical protein VMD25_14285 [Acidobacteriaceae bacterium]|nr:hypothetical protein [Acidobacteriaceae bacterium]
MEGDITPRPYRHPDGALKVLETVICFLAVNDLLRAETSLNRWLVQLLALMCSLVVWQLFPPRLSLARAALLSGAYSLVVAAEWGVYRLMHLHS